MRADHGLGPPGLGSPAGQTRWTAARARADLEGARHVGSGRELSVPGLRGGIVHTLAATAVTIVAETVHTSGVAERNETGIPDDA